MRMNRQVLVIGVLGMMGAVAAAKAAHTTKEASSPENTKELACYFQREGSLFHASGGMGAINKACFASWKEARHKALFACNAASFKDCRETDRYDDKDGVSFGFSESGNCAVTVTVQGNRFASAGERCPGSQVSSLPLHNSINLAEISKMLKFDILRSPTW